MKMDCWMVYLILTLVSLFPGTYAWGRDGHSIVCKIAQSRLTEKAEAAVKKLLPPSANNELANVCSWADQVNSLYPWSTALHFINTPDNFCNYTLERDCKDGMQQPNRCVAGAIKNYTSHLRNYVAGPSQNQINNTEVLMFLAHFMGDIHQPLHVGFTSDKGGNTIRVRWHKQKDVLHRVWDSGIIREANYLYMRDCSKFCNLLDVVQHWIELQGANEVRKWETCGPRMTTCPDTYASESINAACSWAYRGVAQNSKITEAYFKTRLPIVQRRLAQAGVRLAATLNRIFR